MNFSWYPIARVGMRYDDNVLGQPKNAQDALGFDTGGSVSFKADSETWNSALTPRFNIRRFAVGDNLDAEEYSVDFKNQMTRERWSAGLSVRYAQDSTLSSEVTNLGVRNAVTDRDTLSVDPTLSYAFSDRTTLQAAFGYQDVSFSGGLQTGYIGYQYMMGSFTLTHAVNEMDKFFASPFVSDFRVPEVNSHSRTYGGQAGYQKFFTPTFDVTAALGFESSEVQFDNQSPDLTRPVLLFDRRTGQLFTIFPFVRTFSDQTSSDGLLVNVNIHKKFELTDANLEYARQVSPTARGAQEVTDIIDANATRLLTDRAKLHFYGSYVMGDSAAQVNIPNLTREQTYLQGGISYRLYERLTIDTSYWYAYRPGAFGSGSVSQQGIYLYLTYDGGPRSFVPPFWSGF